MWILTMHSLLSFLRTDKLQRMRLKWTRRSLLRRGHSSWADWSVSWNFSSLYWTSPFRRSISRLKNKYYIQWKCLLIYIIKLKRTSGPKQLSAAHPMFGGFHNEMLWVQLQWNKILEVLSSFSGEPLFKKKIPNIMNHIHGLIWYDSRIIVKNSTYCCGIGSSLLFGNVINLILLRPDKLHGIGFVRTGIPGLSFFLKVIN